MAGSFYHNLEVDNAVEIQKIEEPFLWIHGEEDDYVGIQHGEQIIKNYYYEK